MLWKIEVNLETKCWCQILHYFSLVSRWVATHLLQLCICWFVQLAVLFGSADNIPGPVLGIVNTPVDQALFLKEPALREAVVPRGDLGHHHAAAGRPLDLEVKALCSRNTSVYSQLLDLHPVLFLFWLFTSSPLSGWRVFPRKGWIDGKSVNWPGMVQTASATWMLAEFESENHSIRKEFRDNLACSFPEIELEATQNLSWGTQYGGLACRPVAPGRDFYCLAAWSHFK